MKFYYVTYTSDYESYLLDEDWDLEIFESIDRLEPDWGEKELYNGEKNRKPDIAYFSDCPGNMLISEKAYDCLKDILDLEDIELLRTKYKETKYLLIHGIKAYDVNYELISVPNEKLQRIVFSRQGVVKHGLNHKSMFRTKFKNGEPGELLVTEKFIDTVYKFHLKGCEFKFASQTDDEYLVELLVEKVNKYCKNILKQKETQIVDMYIDCFNDGELTDLGVNIRVHDVVTDKYWSEYLSFIDCQENLEKQILSYLDTFSKEERNSELEFLAVSIKNHLENKFA